MMTETLFILAFFCWYFLSLAVSESRGKAFPGGTEWLFFLCMLASPVAGYLFSLVWKRPVAQD